MHHICAGSHAQPAGVLHSPMPLILLPLEERLLHLPPTNTLMCLTHTNSTPTLAGRGSSVGTPFRILSLCPPPWAAACTDWIPPCWHSRAPRRRAAQPHAISPAASTETLLRPVCAHCSGTLHRPEKILHAFLYPVCHTHLGRAWLVSRQPLALLRFVPTPLHN